VTHATSVDALLLSGVLFTSGAGCAATSPPAVFDASQQAETRDHMLARAREADVVLIGEIHGHPQGLTFAAELYESLLAGGARAPLSMEFLERDVQPSVDAFLAGEIDETTFRTRARQGGAYALGHGRMIRDARDAKLPVIAANAPRAYAKRARVDGYDVLRKLPEAERVLFAIPEVLPSGSYATTFRAMMGGGDAHAGHTIDVDAFFRAQALWDATMAESVSRASIAGKPVVHVVGRFHVENDGGLVQLLHRASPKLRTFVVAMLEREDEVTPGRADAMVVVGEAPVVDAPDEAPSNAPERSE
jgi:uncharacterized iron-regulated protein